MAVCEEIHYGIGIIRCRTCCWMCAQRYARACPATSWGDDVGESLFFWSLRTPLFVAVNAPLWRERYAELVYFTASTIAFSVTPSALPVILFLEVQVSESAVCAAWPDTNRIAAQSSTKVTCDAGVVNVGVRGAQRRERSAMLWTARRTAWTR